MHEENSSPKVKNASHLSSLWQLATAWKCCPTKPKATCLELGLYKHQWRCSAADPDLWPPTEWASWKKNFSYIGWILHVNSQDGGLRLPHRSVRPALQSTGLFPAAGLLSRLELWWKDSSKHSTKHLPHYFAVHPISSFLMGMSWPWFFFLTYFFMQPALIEGYFSQPGKSTLVSQSFDSQLNSTSTDCTTTWRLVKTWSQNVRISVGMIRACIFAFQKVLSFSACTDAH